MLLSELSVSSRVIRDWCLPILACTAIGGNAERAIPVAAAIGCIQVSIILIDDLLDKDPRGEYHTIGEAEAANSASHINPLTALIHLPDHQLRLAPLQ